MDLGIEDNIDVSVPQCMKSAMPDFYNSILHKFLHIARIFCVWPEMIRAKDVSYLFHMNVTFSSKDNDNLEYSALLISFTLS